MMRRKGWWQEYSDMTAEQRVVEIRRLERARGYIYDRDAKLRFLSITAPLVNLRVPAGATMPGDVTWLPPGTLNR